MDRQPPRPPSHQALPAEIPDLNRVHAALGDVPVNEPVAGHDRQQVVAALAPAGVVGGAGALASLGPTVCPPEIPGHLIRQQGQQHGNLLSRGSIQENQRHTQEKGPC